MLVCWSSPSFQSLIYIPLRIDEEIAITNSCSPNVTNSSAEFPVVAFIVVAVPKLSTLLFPWNFKILNLLLILILICAFVLQIRVYHVNCRFLLMGTNHLQLKRLILDVGGGRCVQGLAVVFTEPGEHRGLVRGIREMTFPCSMLNQNAF